MTNFADKLSLPQASLDLHDYGPIRDFEVQELVERFIHESYSNNLRKVLIITGKGLNSAKGPKVKPQVLSILKKFKLVKDFHPASLDRGGEGAIEVYLLDQ